MEQAIEGVAGFWCREVGEGVSLFSYDTVQVGCWEAAGVIPTVREDRMHDGVAARAVEAILRRAE